VVQETLADHEPAVTAAGLDLRRSLPDHPVTVRGDPTRIAQVVGNLVHNARKFTPIGGHVTVALEARAGGEARLVVEDDGAGIAREQLGRIFDPFVQGAVEPGHGGLGLGLALVRGLVHLHHGRVEAHSDGVGRGSRFVVALPLSEDERGAGAQPPEAARAPRRVLVVEDNPDAAAMLRLLLQLGGHEVLVAGDGATALRIARSLRPEVVLCDIGLPDMDGYAVARALRAEHGPEPFLVALTGFGQGEDQRKALEAGFDRHVTKPVEPEALEALVVGGRT
jgi:CheY-like chemotaxis protein